MRNTGALSAKQAAVIAALLDSRTVTDASEKTGTPARTIYRWLADPAFKASLSAAEEGMIDEAVRRLLQLQQGALNALQDVLEAKDTPPSARVAAAGRVLDALLKLRELRVVEARLSAIEAQLGGGAADKSPSIILDM